MANIDLHTILQLRNDTEAKWIEVQDTVIPKKGEACISLDKGKIKIGDGTSTWKALKYINATPEELSASGVQNVTVSGDGDTIINAVFSGGVLTITKGYRIYTLSTDNIASNAPNGSVTLKNSDGVTESTAAVKGLGSAAFTASTAYDAAGTGAAEAKKVQGDTTSTVKTVEDIAAAAMPKTGGAFTGAVTVQAPTENMNPATKQYVDTAISGITDFDIDANEGSGYATLEALKQAHPTGEKGIFYLVVNPEAGADNAYIEYFWTGTAYEMAGKFGSVDTSDFATKTELSEGLDLKVDKTTTVNGQALSGNVTITDITGNAGTADVADKVANKLTINGQEYDGSAAVNVTTPNDNTTYTFTSGDDGSFTVQPSGGAEQTVSIGKPATAGTADAVAWTGVSGKPSINVTGGVTGTLNLSAETPQLVTTLRALTDSDIPTGITASKISGLLTNATIAGASVTSAVANATNATNDASGNNIEETYATKAELPTAETLGAITGISGNNGVTVNATDKTNVTVGLNLDDVFILDGGNAAGTWD